MSEKGRERGERERESSCLTHHWGPTRATLVDLFPFTTHQFRNGRSAYINIENCNLYVCCMCVCIGVRKWMIMEIE